MSKLDEGRNKLALLFDIETSGPKKQFNRIIAMAFILVDLGTQRSPRRMVVARALRPRTGRRGSADTQNQIFRPGKGEAISRVRWRYATLARSFVGRWRLGCPRCLQLKLVRFPVPRCGV